jgi:hypothetical protein
MSYQVGDLVWIPCEVKPGPFSDERIIRINSARGPWVGFVPAHALRESVKEGSTAVRAVIVQENGTHFNARVAGEPVTSSVFEGTLSRVEPIAALQA